MSRATNADCGTLHGIRPATLHVQDLPEHHDLWINGPAGAPLGAVALSLDVDGALIRVRLEPRRPRGEVPPLPEALRPAAKAAREQLMAYLAGRLQRFSLPWRLPAGASPFRRAVLAIVAEIPFGQTLGYGEVAARAGHAGAARAVGGAMATNPLPLVIPCHRVVGARGRLGGFTGGLDQKRALLAHEGRLLGGPTRNYR